MYFLGLTSLGFSCLNMYRHSVSDGGASLFNIRVMIGFLFLPYVPVIPTIGCGGTYGLN